MLKTNPREILSAIGLVVERGRRLRTSQRVSLSALGLAHPERVDYQPSGWLSLRSALRPADVSPSDVFADIGCGKGRIVYQAARRYPFGKVIGIELSPDLCKVAEANVNAHRERLRCPNVEIATADALEWPIPDDLSFAYMFSPFTGETFRAFIDRLIASHDRAPRRLRLLYVNPEEHEALMATGRFRELPLPRTLIARVKRYSTDWARLYELTGRGAATRAPASP